MRRDVKNVGGAKPDDTKLSYLTSRFYEVISCTSRFAFSLSSFTSNVLASTEEHVPSGNCLQC